MSVKVRYWSFAALLALAVGGAVSALTAQGAEERREGTDLGDHRQVMVLDGRGSRLGVMVQDLGPADKNTSGVRVESVDADSPAEKAGIRAGDIVVEYDGERVRSARQFTRLVQETPEGRSVPLAVLRDGRRQALTATPEARAYSWNFDIDGDRIRRDVERSLEGLRGWRMDVPPMQFRFDHELGERLAPSSRRPLGVSVDSMGDQLAQYFGATDGGALVTSVEKGSAAERAGLRAGDVITSINGNRVRDANQLVDAMRDIREGEVTIGYLRDKQPGTAKATIEPGSESRSRTPAARQLRARPV